VTTKGLTLKVGVFVLLGIVLSTIAVFTIGDNRRVWDRKVTFYAAYDDVVGLRPGSVVRMGGIDIGSVASVEHRRDVGDNKVYVSFSIARDEAGRIRNATVASIEGKGLLGDKMVVLADDKKLAEEQKGQGKDPYAVLPPEGWLTTAAPADPVGDAEKAAKGAKAAMEN
jgi:phospholipid/cholesterol/gamma-HCH transport system substrate-binding protein